MPIHTSFIGSIVGSGIKAITGLFTGGGAAATAARGVATIAGGTALGIGAANLFGGDGDGGVEDFDGLAAAGTKTRTIVQTLNREGQIVRQKVLRGSPHLMNRDLMIAKRVFRVASKLHGKLPRRTVKESEITSLKNRIVTNALNKAGAPCPE